MNGKFYIKISIQFIIHKMSRGRKEISTGSLHKGSILGLERWLSHSRLGSQPKPQGLVLCK